MSRAGQFSEKESRFVVVGAVASRGRAVSADRRGVSLGDDDNVLALDRDDSCTTL